MRIGITPATMFTIGFFVLLISGALTGIFFGNSTLDIKLHDTYLVIAHYHIIIGFAVLFAIFARVYYLFPKIFGRFMNSALGHIHFWITLVGSYCIFWPMHYMGLTGMPRRYYTSGPTPIINDYSALNEFITIAALVVFAAQLVFIFNFFYSIWKGKKRQDLRNP